MLLWINDGLMAKFFFLMDLELKWEFVEDKLNEKSKVISPAIGGMSVPVLMYVFINYDDPVALQGWTIPAAIDITFLLGIALGLFLEIISVSLHFAG